MAGIVEIDWHPAPRVLRQFAACLLFVAAAASVLMRHTPERLWLAGLLPALLGITGLVRPALLRPVFILATLIAFPFGWVISHAVLALFYYGILTPAGVLMRALGHDPLTRCLDRKAGSHWVAVEPQTEVKRYFKQY